jgi:two-component system LytT family response regulator
MKIVIVDDEQGSIEILQQKITEYVEGINIIATFANPREALPFLQEGNFDVLFLDVDMPGLNGFELINKIEEVKFEIVFTTAYNQFAIDAIRLGAFDYLTKPILIDDLQKCIARLKNFIVPKFSDSIPHFDLIHTQTEKLLISTNEAFEYLPIESIIILKAEGNYTSVISTTSKSILVAKTLGDYEEQLYRYGFIRVHNSFLVNIKHVRRFVKEDGGYLEVTNHHQVFVSKRKKDEILNILKANSL